MSETTNTEKNILNIRRTPISFTSGLFILGIIIFIIIFFLLGNKKGAKEFVENFKYANVYRIENQIGNWTTYNFIEVIRIKGDSVFAHSNKFAYMEIPTRLDKNDNFVEGQQIIYLKTDLMRLFQNSKIKAVKLEYSGEKEGQLILTK